MRLGRRASIRIRVLPAHTRPAQKRLQAALLIWVMVLVLAIAGVGALRRVVHVVQVSAEKHCNNLAAHALETALSEVLAAQSYTYEDFVDLRTDAHGQVQSLAVNPRTVNAMKNAVALAVEEKLEAVSVTKLQIPYLAFLFQNISVGYGPCVDVMLLPDGSCTVDFENSFSAAGINQTNHRLDLIVEASFTAMTALSGTQNTVHTAVPVAQTVIVGTVPESYFQIQP